MADNTENFNKVIKQSEKDMLSIKLIDIDTIVAKYMEESVVPELEQNGRKIKVPIIYGNPERWKTAQRDGHIKDSKGRIQIPLIMFRRNSIAKNENLKFLREEAVTYPTVRKYSKKNTYDRFSLLNPGFAERYDTFDVRMPDYVNLSYEIIAWTSYTEHSNKLVEAFTYSVDRYWGDKDKYKFRAAIDSFETTTEMSENSERLVKTTFTLLVYAYVLPERIEGVPTTIKSVTGKKVVVTSETVTSIENANEFTNVTGERYITKKR